jgi:formylglycine-generating enzyme required for sulfatase activity
MMLASREWPAVRDSADPQRLERFERYFAGTFHAEEARALRERIEAEAAEAKRSWQAAEANRQEAEVKRLEAERERQQQQDVEQKLRAEGRIPVVVGDRKNSQTRWLSPGAGEVFCDIEGGPEMVVVPAGTFMMGSPDEEPERFSNEGPRHPVTFARPFAVARDAVMRGQFAVFVDSTGRKTNDRWLNPGFEQNDSHPVVCISWEDARAYAAWLADITGRPYRLLTEAEREYVTRAGTGTPFWWGSSITPAQANYNYRRSTVPVGSFDPNRWGLYNVHGNVWEWCEDIWHASYRGAPTDGSAWIPDRASRRHEGSVVRGGSWEDGPGSLRSAKRIRYTVLYRSIGFRVARTLTS